MKNDKILIEIPSYCDTELINTINSAIIQADYPERVYFSICYQGDEVDNYEKLKKIKNCKIKWLKENETKGLCYARYLCQKMIYDEKYIYQIDSHMRFVKHWDTRLIEELLSLNDEKAIISFYPSACTDEMMKLPLDDKIFDNPTSGGLMYISGFFNENTPFVEISCEIIEKNDPRAYIKSAFISGGNFFSFSNVHKEVFNNPNMYFYADELFMSINLFTHGWNIYNSGVGYIYHQYNRNNSKFPKIDNAVEKEKQYFLNLLNCKNNKTSLKKFNIGEERTIEEYEKFSGIDFKNRIIYMNAEMGEIENTEYIGKISYLSKKNLEREKVIHRQDIIEVLIVDLYGEYKDCIKSCLETSLNKDRINFIVGTNDNIYSTNEECSIMKIKKIISYGEKSSYSEIISDISKYVDDNYVTIVDSSVRFLKGWDKYLCDNLKVCGNKAVLTSWIYKINDSNINSFFPYINISKKLKEFYNYLPILEYDIDVDLSVMDYPYQTAFLFDGFIFCHSQILKMIEFDPILNYEEQKYLYAIRLWTNGINIYLPKLSYMVRNKDESLLNTDNYNLDVVCALSGINNYYSKRFESDYFYDIGNERPLWTWYKFINVDYNKLKKQY